MSGDQLPPHDYKAEQAVLGLCLMDPQVIAQCQARFASDEVFYDLRNQCIWSAICYVKFKGAAVDTITVGDELKARGQLEQVGDFAYLNQIQNDVSGMVWNLPEWLTIVWEKFGARRLIQTGYENIDMVMQSGGMSESLVARVSEKHQEWEKLQARGQVTPKNLCEPAQFADGVYDCWFTRQRDDYGWELPFKFPMRIRPSEMTLFTGDNGAGKSSMLGLISIICAKQFKDGEKVVVASMEVPPDVTLWIMTRQLLGIGRLDKTHENELRIVEAMAFLQKHMLIYNFKGITDWRELLSTFQYAREYKKGAVFIVDSVMRIGIPDDDYAMQGIVAAQFADFSVKTGAHTFLVVHENKGEGNQKNRVRGSKQWTDNAHNVCAIRRNESKDEKIEEWKAEVRAGECVQEEFDRRMAGIRKVWDSKFILNKQRWPGSQQNASRWLYFDRGSLQFHEQPEDSPYNLLL